MIIKPLFKKNYFIFSAIILSAIFLAFVLSQLIAGWERNAALIKFNSEMLARPAPVPQVGKMFLTFEPDPYKLVDKIKDVAKQDQHLKVYLLNAQGVDLNTHEIVLPAPLTAEQLQELKKGQTIMIGHEGPHVPPHFTLDSTSREGVYLALQFTPEERARRDFDMGPPPEPPRGFFDFAHGPPGPPPPGDLRGPPPMGFPGRGGPPPHMIALTICCIVGFVFVSVGISLFLQASKYHERAEDALHVLNELRQGNFLARMPAKKFDELEPLVVAFNLMADDLESMVGRLQSADRQRRQLLQDLAHDLRTPMTSLRTFLEILKNSDNRISEEKRQEVLGLCFVEIHYFGKLVEDLLFLAQITEPKYSLGSEPIRLSERIHEQITVFQARCPDIAYEFSMGPDAQNAELIGSMKLIDRLLRNAFENSSSFARSKVTVTLQRTQGQLQVAISDDGPGFSAEALREFGQKKTSRSIASEKDGARISVGIGSVIMKEISQLHSGTLKAENIVEQGVVKGSRVSVTFQLV